MLLVEDRRTSEGLGFGFWVWGLRFGVEVGVVHGVSSFLSHLATETFGASVLHLLLQFHVGSRTLFRDEFGSVGSGSTFLPSRTRFFNLCVGL